MTSFQDAPKPPEDRAVEPEGQAFASEGPAELLRLVALLWRRKWVIVAAVGTVLFVASLYILRATPIYRASADFVVIRQTGDILRDDSRSNPRADMTSFLKTQCQVLTSPRLISMALEHEGIKDLPGIQGLKQPVEALRGSLNAVAQRDTDVLTVTFEGHFPDTCAEFTNTLVQSFIEYHGQLHKSVASDVLVLLKTQRGELEKELRGDQEKLLGLTDKESVGFTGQEGVDSILQHLTALRTSLTSAQLETVKAAIRCTQLEATLRNPEDVWQFMQAEDPMLRATISVSPWLEQARRIGDALSNARTDLALLQSLTKEISGKGAAALTLDQPALAAFAKQRDALVQAQIELEQLVVGQGLGDSHPLVVGMREKAKSLGEELLRSVSGKCLELEQTARAMETEFRNVCSKLGTTLIGAAKNELSICTKKEERLSALLTEETQRTRELRKNTLEYQIVEASIKRTQDLYQVVVDRMKEINLSQDYETVRIDLLSPATPPGAPAKPQKALILTIALVLGLMLGAFAAWIIEFLDVRLRDPEEGARLLNAPLLGTVPLLSRKPGESEDESRREVGFACWLRPSSGAANAYRRIRTAIEFGAPGSNGKKILVTSPVPGDGKTTLAINLAVSMALNGRRVLLVDGDLRKPRIGRTFCIHRKEGLTDLLIGDAQWEDCVRTSDVPNLEILTHGSAVPRPAEFLGSDAFAQLIKKVEGRYDRIIFDSAPLLPVPDAQILAAIMDQTVLVVLAKNLERPLIARSRKLLRGVGMSTIGLVINGFLDGRAGRYPGSYYGKRRLYGRYDYHYYGEPYGDAEPTEQKAEPHAEEAKACSDSPDGRGEPRSATQTKKKAK